MRVFSLEKTMVFDRIKIMENPVFDSFKEAERP